MAHIILTRWAAASPEFVIEQLGRRDCPMDRGLDHVTGGDRHIRTGVD
jgi:hypothetical protein